MRSIIGASLLAMLLSTTAIADTSSINSDLQSGTDTFGILENDYVRAGVNGITGTLGSGHRQTPGLLYDSTGSGNFNTSYDYLTPGTPFDGWSVSIDGTNYTNNNNSNTKAVGGMLYTDTNIGLVDGTDTLTWESTGDRTDFEIEHVYSLGATSEHIEIGTTITMKQDASDVWFGRFIDPDARAASGDSSATDNVLGYGVIPDSNVAFSEATTSRYALGLYSTDSNVDAGISSPYDSDGRYIGWSNEADGYTGSPYTDSDGNSVNYGTGDHTIGLSWNWTTVSTGDILSASYAYIFGPSAFDAADTAITAGAGGGADISSWGTLEDVGSATDAASGTAEPEITYSDPVVDTDLPVLTQTQTTHDSTTAAGVQTIARETTTVVTTPMEIIEYTDGVETDRTSTDSDVVTTVTDPGSFVGRMDQVDQMLGLKAHRNLGIGNGISGSRISHDMGNGYSAESQVLSLGGELIAENGLRLGAGYNRVNTDLTGTDSSGTMESNVISVEAGKHINGRDITVTGNANVANSDMSYSRTIGDFSAAGETSGQDMWGGLTVEKSTGQLRPFAGVTVGNKSTDAYDETGNVQATLSHLAVDETYRYGTLGFNIDTGAFTASVAKDFGDSEAMRIGVGINRNINERLSIGASANRITDGDNTSTRLSAGIKISF